MEKNYEAFRASLLYCNTCARAMPVRERLLLVLANGELYDYLCRGCGNSLGTKTEKTHKEIQTVKTRSLPKIPPKS